MYDKYISQKLTEETQKEIQGNYNHVRVWRPGTIGTCDYRSDRLNIHINENDVITEIAIG